MAGLGVAARSRRNGLCPPLRRKSHFCRQNEFARSGRLSHLSLRKTSSVSSGSSVTDSQPHANCLCQSLGGGGHGAAALGTVAFWTWCQDDVAHLVPARFSGRWWRENQPSGGGGAGLGVILCPPPPSFVSQENPALSLRACWEGRAPWPGALSEACSPGFIAWARVCHCDAHVLPDHTAM